MEWEWAVTTTIPVLTFIAGLWWSRYDGDRRERRARHAAAVAAFEQLQRETHLEVQDTLTKTFHGAARAAAARQAHPSEALQTRAALDEFHIAAQRAVVLESRLADSGIRELVGAAIESSNALAHASGTKLQEATDRAASALEEAILELGTLIGQPPRA
jgi:hypothetical protein